MQPRMLSASYGEAFGIDGARRQGCIPVNRAARKSAVCNGAPLPRETRELDNEQSHVPDARRQNALLLAAQRLPRRRLCVMEKTAPWMRSAASRRLLFCPPRDVCLPIAARNPGCRDGQDACPRHGGLAAPVCDARAWYGLAGVLQRQGPAPGAARQCSQAVRARQEPATSADAGANGARLGVDDSASAQSGCC